MTDNRRIAAFLGLRGGMVGLLGAVILVGMGEKIAERFLPVYLLAMGGGAISIGLLNGLDNLLSALYAVPGGWLSDRYGARRALLIFNLLAMFGFVIVIAVPSWGAVIVGSFFFLSWTAISLPATMSLVSRVLPAGQRTMGVAMHSLVRRVPMALGPLLGGALIDAYGETTGVRYAFVAALAMALLACVLQQKLIPEDREADRATPEKNPLRLFAHMNSALRRLLVSDILIRFCEQIPYAFAVVWCMKTIEHPVTGFQFGILTTVEMATAVLIYLPVAYMADRTEKKPWVLTTFVFFTLFPVALMFSHSFWPLVGAFVLRGLKEFGEPTRKALILDLAPEGRKAAVFGLYYLMRDSVVAVAAFAGAFLWNVDPRLNLWTAFAFGVLGTAWFTWRGEGYRPAIHHAE
ncbi:MAG: MFS transporter [Deltaproteobacteria bacterium]|nr:MFS transporter [Deltaproteobacteria bacterium]